MFGLVDLTVSFTLHVKMVTLDLFLILLLSLGRQQKTLGETATLAPPQNLQANQASISDQIDIVWTPPPSYEDNNITEYRIFFESGENISVPSIVTSVGLIVDGVSVGQHISIRSEIANDESYSEMINATISRLTGSSRSTTNSAAIVLGIVLGLVVLVATTLTTILLLKVRQLRHLLQMSCDAFKTHTIIRDPKTSENIAYASVSLTSSTCEEVQTLVNNRSQEAECTCVDDHESQLTHPAYETVYYNQLVD